MSAPLRRSRPSRWSFILIGLGAANTVPFSSGLRVLTIDPKDSLWRLLRLWLFRHAGRACSDRLLVEREWVAQRFWFLAALFVVHH